jgi:hypothetical protein
MEKAFELRLKDPREDVSSSKQLTDYLQKYFLTERPSLEYDIQSHTIDFSPPIDLVISNRKEFSAAVASNILGRSLTTPVEIKMGVKDLYRWDKYSLGLWAMTLAHEVAHVFVIPLMYENRTVYHSPTFYKVCKLLGGRYL